LLETLKPLQVQMSSAGLSSLEMKELWVDGSKQHATMARDDGVA
jgi:hypothetical protein